MGNADCRGGIAWRDAAVPSETLLEDCLAANWARQTVWQSFPSRGRGRCCWAAFCSAAHSTKPLTLA